MLKQFIYWGLFYAVLHCIDDERDLKIQFTMFSLAAVIGSLLVILQFYFPYQMDIFALPDVEGFRNISEEGRAAGAFTNSNAAACVMGCSMVMVVTAFRLQRRLISKIIVYSFIFILLIAILYTRSRSGLLAITGTFIFMLFKSQSKKVVWLVVIAAVIIMISFAGMRGLYQERIAKLYDPEAETWGGNVVGRVEAWKGYFRTATLRDYIFGQGTRRAAVRNDGESHSAYVSLITVYGLGGVIWAVCSLVVFLKKTRSLKYFPTPIISTVSAGCAWALLFWGIYGITSDAISSAYPRYLLFYIIVLVDRASSLAQQEGLEWELYDADEQYFDTLSPQGEIVSW